MNKNAFTTFNFNTASIRVVEIEGKPWFVASDVAAILGFRTTAGAGWYARHLDSGERNTITLADGMRGNPNKTAVTESGLYKLILRSDKPEAKPFQDWVTQIVLPAIRKDGGYIAGEEKVATGEMSEDELVFKAMAVMQRKIGAFRPRTLCGTVIVSANGPSPKLDIIEIN